MDTEAGFISDAGREIVQMVNTVALTNAIVVFGLASNTTNILVFLRQGFRESTTVTLFSLSLLDLLSLILLSANTVFFVPGFRQSSQVAATLYRYRIVFGQAWHVTRLIAVWITLLVTVERCIAIASPLKVKVLCTPRKSALAVVGISISMVLPVVLLVSLFYSGRPFPPHKIGESHNNSSTVDGPDRKTNTPNIYQSIVLGLNVVCHIVSLIAVTVSNLWLIIALNKRKSSHGYRNPRPASRLTARQRIKSRWPGQASPRVHPISATVPGPDLLSVPNPLFMTTVPAPASATSVERHPKLSGTSRLETRTSSDDSSPEDRSPPSTSRSGDDIKPQVGEVGGDEIFAHGRGGGEGSFAHGRGGEEGSFAHGRGGEEGSFANGCGGEEGSFAHGRGGEEGSFAHRRGGGEGSFAHGLGGEEGSFAHRRATGAAAIAATAKRRAHKLARMVIVLSGIVLASYLPGIVCLITGLVEPQFRSTER